MANKHDTPMSKKEPRSERPTFDVEELARQIAMSRALTAEVAQLICELERCAAEAESQLRKAGLAPVLPFPLPN